MRAMVMDKFGASDVLHIGEIDKPAAGPNEIVVQIAYAGVNPADWKCREGWLSQFFKYEFPFVVGFDGSGIVSEVGTGVDGVNVGDRVVARSNVGGGQPGTYAEYVKCSSGYVVPIADSVSLETAATIPTAAITSWEGLFEIGKLKAGQTLLVHGGAGSCGTFAIQFAKNAGAKVAATCGPNNVDYVREIGADLVINYRAENIKESLLKWARDGVDLILDTVGQGTLPDGIEMVKPGGMLTNIGTLIADEPQFDPERAKERGVRLAMTMSSRERDISQLAAIVAQFNEGKLRAPDVEIMPLEDAGKAHDRVQDGHVRGKILLKVADL